jgi:sialate O-acetylesterase
MSFPARLRVVLQLVPLVLLSGWSAVAGRAEVALAPLFTDGAVLQQGKSVPVWGTAAPGERVHVSFAGQTASTVTDADGRWLVLLEPLAPTLTGADLVAEGSNTQTAHDVLVGEVWLCAGDEIFERPVAQAPDAAHTLADAARPLIRQFTMPRASASAAPAGRWQSATPGSLATFSAAGYSFARQLQPRLGVPIGIIQIAWARSTIAAWLSPHTVATDPAAQATLASWRQTMADHPAARARYEAELAAWKAEAARHPSPLDQAAFLRKRPQPAPPLGPDDPIQPAALYSGMVSPIVPCALRGILWGQGQADALQPEAHGHFLAALISSWRAAFGQDALPFYYVQLAEVRLATEAGNASAARLREAQQKALALPATGMAVSIDTGNSDGATHNTPEIGRRLALLARAATYHQPCDYTGPVFAGATREGSAMRVRFSHADTGLIAHDRPVQSLQLAGEDRRFYPAEGRLDGATLLVSSRQVPNPVAVRYAWTGAPGANLFNGSGLPAAPFRSDAW